VRKRRTEVDAQLGIVVTLGHDVAVPTPLTERLVELIHDIETGVRAQSLDTLDILAACRTATALHGYRV
jgi:2-dehydropantoate 2-reductase